jgi:hypothetical protein
LARGIADCFHQSCWSLSVRYRFLPSLRSGQAGLIAPRNDILHVSFRSRAEGEGEESRTASTNHAGPHPCVTDSSLRSGQAGLIAPRNDILRRIGKVRSHGMSFRGCFSGRGIGDCFHKSCLFFSTRYRFLPSLRSGQAGLTAPRNDI